MDARQLRYFLAVVDAEGFGKAAERLYIAQPSLSQAIAGLERELGVALFHRVGRGVVLSDAGKQLIGPARQVIRDLATAQATIDAIKGVARGRVEITSMPSAGIQPLAPIMQRFAAAHPDVTVSVNAAFVPDEVIDAVRTGAVEIGLLGAPDLVRVAELDIVALEDQPLMLFTAPGGPFHGRDHVTADDLDGHRLIASQPGSLMRQLVDHILAQGSQARLVAEVAHRTSILPLVLAGVADAILPAAWKDLAIRAGADVLPIRPTAHLRVVMVSRRTQLTPAARAFIDVAQAYRAERRDRPVA
ncbi:MULTISPECIES: LysR family transcriptional regulator [Micromonospora]|uniref:LysR family transcriptional regulator n=1 Tax=Verrucosispora sioxanthis TaxID=2499994 RepID=A0A6M1KZC7_9ACTN|nr:MULTISPECIES: LysR family transcriptional regulator [Micromonospora]MCZ7422355.1 LysR family transcriptional regulator [Verrucosispora sp. WMMA2121]NEE64339.1 LysR family transcriptional regulator [Verrucosispora sioxanthis]NGM13449.1 LysR family transcriptional regulator [Verrucosispora sioxanthis]WBB51431.1 LysR family transcriptional regulator [Verrucosispora sp. WMMA2044]WBB52677.1 LysR family transcriptional regulator [Verrucosispora sp. WMMD573]